MVGSAVATMVWSRAASSMPSTIARKMRLRRCGLINALLDARFAAGAARVGDAALGLIMPAFPSASDASEYPGSTRSQTRQHSEHDRYDDDIAPSDAVRPRCRGSSWQRKGYPIEPGGRETHCAEYSSSPSLSISSSCVSR